MRSRIDRNYLLYLELTDAGFHHTVLSEFRTCLITEQAEGLIFEKLSIASARLAFLNPVLLGAGIGVGICSSVIPYVCDQLAMARLSRPTFALLLSLLPATATAIGVLVLRQIPTTLDLVGIAFVVVGVAIHRS